jgi:ABC-type uncharacterized transport system auxiliary subunit
MKIPAVAVLGALALAGCGSVRYPSTYVLNLPASPARTAAPAAKLGSVAVREFHCADYLCEGRIVYRPSREEVAFYEYHRWAMSPRQAITQFVADALEGQSLFASVVVHERGVMPEYVLTGNIQRLEEEDQNRDVRAVCTISAQLMEVRTGSVVWRETISEAVPVQQRNVGGVVIGLSEAVRITTDRLIGSMATRLAAAPVMAVSSQK